MIDVYMIKIPELTGDEERRAYVYLPAAYESEPDRRFPVLYMFDGHNVFYDSDATYGKSWGMKEYMDKEELPLIIVAIECNHSPDYGRLREYSPYTFDDPEFGHIPGFGRITMEWFTKVLKPMVDETYRTLTDRDNTCIAGSSMGGLMSLYALIGYCEYFSGAACLSPSFWTAPERLIELIERAELPGPTRIYLDHGSKEAVGRRGRMMARVYRAIVGKLKEKGLFVNSRVVPGGTHTEASWERQIPFFMETLFPEFFEQNIPD